MTTEEAISYAIEGNALLFVGAGFSHDATNISGAKLPIGSQLRDHLAKLTDLEGEVSLSQAADLVLEDKGEDFLAGELRKLYTVRQVAGWQRVVASLPWRRIYTTNYDNVLECAAKQPLTSVSPEDDIYNTPKDSTLCVHLNGSVLRMTRDNIATGIKLTDTSYLSGSSSESQWGALFRQDLSLAKAVFFVGYSLSDLDLKRVLFENSSIAAKCFFVVGSHPSSILRRQVAKFGTLLAINGETFAHSVKGVECSFAYTPSGEQFLELQEFRQVLPEGKLDDEAFRNLMLLGHWQPSQVQESFRNRQRFFLPRTHLPRVASLVETTPVVAVLSHLGNGKTLFIEGLKTHLAQKGYRVFQAQGLSGTVGREIEFLGGLDHKSVLIIDNYQGWLTHIRHFRQTAKKHHRLVITARTPIHDVLVDDLYNAVNIEEIPEVDLDMLQPEELQWVVFAFEEYGMWGDMAAAHNDKKLRRLRDDCHGQFVSILLELLNAPGIEERFRKLLDEASKDPSVFDLLLLVLILRVIGHDVRLNTLGDLADMRTLNSPLVRKSSVLREIVDFGRSEVSLRSPSTARFLLKNLIDPNKVVDLLGRAARRAHDIAQSMPVYEALWKDFMRFANVSVVLPERSIDASVVRYYESLKQLRRARENPLFWLQYGIAALATKQTARAMDYFKTAYAFAEVTGFDAFQIDNHYARALLVNAQERLSVAVAFDAFREARQIINRQVMSELRHYPYRVAGEYQNFLDCFGSELSSRQLEELLSAAKFVLERSSVLAPGVRDHAHVRACVKSLSYVVMRCEELLGKEE